LKKNLRLERLNFPVYEFRLRKDQIFDPARKKFVALTPEEWVRQHVIRYLQESGGYPLSLMAVEAPIALHTLKRRMDILVHSKAGQPLLIVECKAPSVKITQSTFDQAARYNLKAGAPCFFLSNGLSHYYCRVGEPGEPYVFLKSLPSFSELSAG
jgi:type I site-specific restriction endonuclease